MRWLLVSKDKEMGFILSIGGIWFARKLMTSLETPVT